MRAVRCAVYTLLKFSQTASHLLFDFNRRFLLTYVTQSAAVQLGVEDVEGKDREEQVEVEREKRVKEGAPWMTMEMVVTRLRT